MARPKHSEETKQKIRKALLGRVFSPITLLKMREAKLGKPSPKKGSKQRPLTEAHRKKISEGALRAGSGKWMVGRGKKEENNNWRGGIVPEYLLIRTSDKYLDWRQKIFKRDGWTCQKTGITGGKLHAHHIETFAQNPEKRLNINNGITLSTRSHKDFHAKYGNKNTTREQMEEFLGRKLDFTKRS
jgi:hypothetical protein